MFILSYFKLEWNRKTIDLVSIHSHPSSVLFLSFHDTLIDKTILERKIYDN